MGRVRLSRMASRTSARMHVHILGLVSLNGGDAAILEGQASILRNQWPDAVITVSDTHPDVAGKYSRDYQFFPFMRRTALRKRRLYGRSARAGQAYDRARLAHWRLVADLHGRGAHKAADDLSTFEQRRAFAPLLAADFIAYTGGTTLTDNYDLVDKVFDLDIVLRLRKKLVFLPQSAGPFRKPENVTGLRPILAAADLILLRDERSRAHVIETGAEPGRCQVVPDVVFALARPAQLERGVARSGRPQIAVSVRRWSHFRDVEPEVGMLNYVASLREVVTRLVRDRDAQVTFISTCQGRPEYWLDDSEFAVEVAEGLPEDVAASVTVDRALHDPHELIDMLAGFDAMISTRLHGAISAVCTGVPTLAIAYEYKTTEVWGQLRVSEWAVDIDDVTPDQLGEAGLRLVDGADGIRERLAETVPEMRGKAMAAGQAVRSVVTDWSGRHSGEVA